MQASLHPDSGSTSPPASAIEEEECGERSEEEGEEKANREEDEDEATNKKEQIRKFGVAGGHASHLSISEDGQTVVKQTTLEEAHFYCWLGCLASSSAAEAPPALGCTGTSASHPSKDFCPLRCSAADCPLLQLQQQTGKPSFPLEPHKQSAQLLLPWLPEIRRVSACTNGSKSKFAFSLEMENLISNLRNPLVIDLKMGTRLYGDLATPSKVERAEKYAKTRGADTLGISFSGLWGEEEGEEIRWDGGSRQKADGFLPTTFQVYVELLRAFLVSGSGPPGAPAQVYRQLLLLLQQLEEVWERQQIVNVYGSSLLLMAGEEEEQQPKERRRKVGLRLVDFAHATLLPVEKEAGYSKGLRTIKAALTEAAKTTQDGPGARGFRHLLSVWQARGGQKTNNQQETEK
ncbi:hypothetical protein Efla_004535 [Eimeria flavescens]